MVRIPDGVIERLKTMVSVQRLAEARGVVLAKHGADLHGRCPFHADRTPSLVITPEKNLWHCLGACQTGGTAIEDAPGIRQGGAGPMYLAYLRDPDGNKLCALRRMPAA